MNIALIVISALALINLGVSVAVLRAVALSPSQRAMQVLLIWLVPLAGATVCAAFVSSQISDTDSRRTVDPPYPEGDGADCGGGEGGGD